MAQRITIEIKNKIAKRLTEVPVVCGNSDYIAEFIFDEEWNAFDIKTARFKINNEYVDVVFAGKDCPMPIVSNAKFIQVGVFAGDLATTTPAIVLCSPSILDGTEIPQAPSEDVYNQIMKLLNDTAEGLEEFMDVSDRVEAQISGFYTLSVDENGNLYAIYDD